ncbi:MAG: diguanylate cyclase [Gammaproteobacteria bacterium]|jgi:diguanylate cyclase (GGDEF)-like protein
MSVNSGEKPRLLIVDDSRVIRVTARKILRDHFETVEAADGEEAWAMLGKDAPYSLVVSDLTMPNLDGYGLLERIRHSHLPHVKDIPVIIITGANDSDTAMERARAAGATDFIGKPFDSVQLLARTQAHASANTSARMLRQATIELEEKSPVDPLTGLANEITFMERGYQQLAYAIRHNTSLSTFRIEIDHYGDLYKRYGAEFAQAGVNLVAEVLRENIRQEDMAARIGTARFALLLQSAGKSGSRNLAERIRSDINKRILRHEGQPVHISVSIGVAAPEIRRDTRFDSMLLVADNHLVHAIDHGGNKVIHDSRDIVRPVRPRNRHLSRPDPATTDDKPVETLAAEALVPESTASHPAATGFHPGMPDTTDPAIAAGTDRAVECLATGTPRPLPGRFAGPVPEGPASFAIEDTAPAGADAVRGRSRFVVPDEEPPEETIVITAPFSAGTDPEPSPAPESRSDGKPPHSGETTPRNPDDVIEVVTVDETDDADDFDRPGLLRRTLTGLRALFGRSREAD